MRRLAAVALAVIAAACANIGAPPGGPTRVEPPKVVAVSPESGAVNVRAERVVFEFDAVVSDRPAGGATTLEQMFLISPQDGSPRVSWERDRIEVRPRRGFRPNTAYSVTLLPGLADLRGNVTRETRTIVFSTGPTIPGFRVRGRVFDWLAERPAVGALVEALRLPDSVMFVGASDSTGQFAIGPLGEGTYAVRTVLDNNRNRTADPNEPWDSVVVTVSTTSPAVELLAAPRDTVAPRLLTATVRDSVTLDLTFDRPLDPAVPLTGASFRVLASDSSRLAVARVVPRRSAARDSAAAVVAPALPPRADTTRVAPPPRPTRPAPVTALALELDVSSPMRPGQSYRVVAVNMRGLLGAIRTSDRVVTMERAGADSTRARP